MFSNEQVEFILRALTQAWHTDPQWELLLREVYLGMARADAGVAFGNLDPRVIQIIQHHQM
jgi:hypothetical protein